MGVFTEITVEIDFETKEDCDKGFEIFDNFESKIKEHIYKEKEFSVNEPVYFYKDEKCLGIKINSGREPHAKFHVNCLIKLMQIYNVKIETFSADITKPCSYIYLDGQGDFNEFEVEFEGL